MTTLDRIGEPRKTPRKSASPAAPEAAKAAMSRAKHAKNNESGLPPRPEPHFGAPEASFSAFWRGASAARRPGRTETP